MSETSWGRRKYRITNWKAYNALLKARGDLSVWLDTTCSGWILQGRSQTFSDVAIQFA